MKCLTRAHTNVMYRSAFWNTTEYERAPVSAVCTPRLSISQSSSVCRHCKSIARDDMRGRVLCGLRGLTEWIEFIRPDQHTSEC